MKDTLSFIVSQLVDHPDAVVIDESQEEDRTIFTIHVAPEDMGKIIGKSGRIIRAIRDLVKLMATKNRTYVDVVLAEEA
jgi:hypothetical protein